MSDRRSDQDLSLTEIAIRVAGASVLTVAIAIGVFLAILFFAG
jgi:hypothetical protein